MFNSEWLAEVLSFWQVSMSNTKPLGRQLKSSFQSYAVPKRAAHVLASLQLNRTHCFR